MQLQSTQIIKYTLPRASAASVKIFALLVNVCIKLRWNKYSCYMSVDGDCDSLVRVIVGDSVAVEVIYKVNTA